MQRIVLASGNAGKLREFSAMFAQHFADAEVQLIPQTELDVSDADETGLSFVENAILKARHACQVTGLPALADDSGIEVDALDGAPGIYSARYSGDSSDQRDAANNAKLLSELAAKNRTEGKVSRRARFQCVLVYMRHANDPTPQVFQGAWEGEIVEQPSGVGGFGYDPLFFVPSEGCTAAELSKERKNALSHRGQAIQQLLARWRP